MAKYLAESERLGLQALSLEDHLDAYHAKMSNAISFKYLHREPSKSIEESRENMISRHLPSAEHPYREMYAMVLKGPDRSDGKPNMIGSVGIPRVTPDAVEVGYGVNANCWGMGYAPEAVKLFIHYYWNIRGGETKDKMIAYTNPENNASARVLEKSGFSRGDVIEKAYEAPDMATKEIRWYPAIIWSLERPKSI